MDSLKLGMALDVEDLLKLVNKLKEAGHLEPKIEDLVVRIEKLQKAKKLINEELKEYNAQSEKLREELELLDSEKSHLEETLNKKHETCRILRLQCEERENESQRQLQLSDECKQRIEELTSKIQEEKLKQRKQRMEFEKQLEELMEKHKSLWEFHTEKRLTSEIENMESRKQHLIAEEETLYALFEIFKKEKELHVKLGHVLQQLDSLGRRGIALREELAFLRSQEATTAVQLFEEENKAAKSFLEAATLRHSELQEKCQRLREELELKAGGAPWNAVEVESSEKQVPNPRDSEDPVAMEVSDLGQQK